MALLVDRQGASNFAGQQVEIHGWPQWFPTHPMRADTIPVEMYAKSADQIKDLPAWWIISGLYPQL